jgi:hypothetical protein
MHKSKRKEKKRERREIGKEQNIGAIERLCTDNGSKWVGSCGRMVQWEGYRRRVI